VTLPSPRVVAEGLGFPESPRWHDGRLWVSDMGARRVVTVEPASGSVSLVCHCPGAPSGLAWDDDGRLLVVSMARRVVFRDDGDERLTTFADLTPFGTSWRNDAVRHVDGWLYVGAVGAEPLVVVDPSGGARAATEPLDGANGMVITPDGSTLLVGELGAGRYTAFEIGADGSLSDRRTWAELPGRSPDGCCLDRDGAVWSCSAESPLVVRVGPGGEVLDEVVASQPAYACMLGGDDGTTLFLCTAPGIGPEQLASAAGRIEAVDVGTGHAGRP
jgi:sugar lactone lactonase YvrE